MSLNLTKQLRTQSEPTEKQSADDAANPLPMREPLKIDLTGTGLNKKVLAKAVGANTRALGNARIAAAEAEAANIAASEAVEAATRLSREARARHISLDPSQLRALDGILHNTCSVLIGAAGTGKTTLLRHLLDEWCILQRERMPDYSMQDIRRTIAIASYTGRASQQCRRVLPDEWSNNVSTIHRLLEFAPVYTDTEVESALSDRKFTETSLKFEPSRTKLHPLEQSFIIIDEASMTPVDLWNLLRDATKYGTRFLLIGDIQQLPPVSSESVLGYAMAEWPVFELTQIHRQAADNPIIANAHRILRGQFPRSTERFYIVGTSTGTRRTDGKPLRLPSSMHEMQSWALRQMVAMRDKGVYVPLRDAIIVPKRTPNSELSSTSLNAYLPSLMNPPRFGEGSNTVLNPRTPIHTGTHVVRLAVGDKILIIENINDHQPVITNGMTGVVERISINPSYDTARGGRSFSETALHAQPCDDDLEEDAGLDIESTLEELTSAGRSDFSATLGENAKDEPDEMRQASHTTVIRFDDGTEYVASTSVSYSKFTFGYALTCHKMQGGECPNVFIIAHSRDIIGNLLTREWLYTAVTRAQQNVFLYTDDTTLGRMITSQKIVGDTLSQKIEAFQAVACAERKTLPDLPKNCEVD